MLIHIHVTIEKDRKKQCSLENQFAMVNKGKKWHVSDNKNAMVAENNNAMVKNDYLDMERSKFGMGVT